MMNLKKDFKSHFDSLNDNSKICAQALESFLFYFL